MFMQMFGGDFVGFITPNQTSLRCDTFWQSFLTLIMVSLDPLLFARLTEPLTSCIRAKRGR